MGEQFTKPVYTRKEALVKALKELEFESGVDPYKVALHAVLTQLAGMACEAAAYTAIVTGYEEE